MKEAIRNILNVWYGELRQVIHDEGLLIFLLLVPLGYPALYSFIYNNETVREVPLAVVDECHSRQSREFVRKVDATAECAVLYYTDMAGARELMRREQVYAILRIPSTFDRDLSRGDQTYIGFYSDMRCMLYYKSVLLASSQVSLDMNHNIKVSQHIKGTTNRQEEISRLPIRYSYIPFYNPQSGFASFLIPAVLMLIIQQLMFLSVGMSQAACRERGTATVVPLRGRAGQQTVSLLTGKTVFYFLWFLLVALFMYAGITRFFALPSLGDYATFLAFVTPYILACIFLSVTLSFFIVQREDVMMLFVFMSVPLLFLAGMSWPVAAEPRMWRAVSWLFPSTFGMHGYVRIMGTGATLHEVAMEYRALWIQCAVYAFTAFLAAYRRLRRV